MDEQAAAVDVAQEVVAEARTVRRALDDAGNVRHDEAHALVDVHDAEVGVERGEVVVGDLRPRLGNDREQRRFADIREADQPHVREQLELQNDVVALAGQARLGKARYLTGGRGEVAVAPAALAAAAEDVRLGRGHILNDLVRLRVAHERAARHADGERLAAFAELAAALTVHAVLGGVFALVAEVHQRGHIVVHLQNDVAAVAAVAAVGTAGCDVFLTVERDRAVAALAGGNGDARLINEFRCHIEKPPSGVLFSNFTILPAFACSVKEKHKKGSASRRLALPFSNHSITQRDTRKPACDPCRASRSGARRPPWRTGCRRCRYRR